MGLDCRIIDGYGGGRIGSYSAVHHLREILLHASIKYSINAMKTKYPLIIDFILDKIVLPFVNDSKILYDDSKILYVFGNELIRKKISIFSTSGAFTHDDIDILSHLMDYYYDDLMDYYYDDADGLFVPLRSFKLLSTWLKYPYNYEEVLNEINYDIIRAFDITSNDYSLARMGLSGLYKFIYHSDCDGIYTPGDCLDIVSTIENIRPFVVDDLIEWIDAVTTYFQDSVDQNKPLKYC